MRWTPIAAPRVCPIGEKPGGRACYLVVTYEQVVFRRVEYPVHPTVEKILAISDLDDSFGERLMVGE